MRSVRVETGKNPHNHRFTPTRELGPLETMERLGFGQVPTKRILAVLKLYGVDPSNHMQVRALHRAKISGYMVFDAADRMLVDAGLVMSWRKELYDLYKEVNLRISASHARYPRVHATVRMYHTGCRCAACVQSWTVGPGRADRLAKAAA